MLQQSDFRILSSLRQTARTVSEISEHTGLAYATVQRRIGTLCDHDLVARLDTTDRSKRYYRPQQSPVATALDSAEDSVPHITLTDFLTPSLLMVVYWLEMPIGPSEIATRVPLTRVRVQQLLATLVRRQFATKTARGQYELKTEYKKVSRLAEAFAQHTQWVEIQDVLADATIIWAAPAEALVVPGTWTTDVADTLADDEWTVTGLSAFQQFGFAATIGDAPLLYRNTATTADEVDICAAEAVCHALCRRVEHRLVRFCALVVLAGIVEDRLSLGELRDTARIYGVEREIDILLAFLQQRGDASTLPVDVASSFPTWERVVDTGTQYNFDVEQAVTQLTTTDS